MKEMTCEEKPKATEEKPKNKRVMIFLAVILGLTILVGGLLDLLADGVPLGFTIPIIGKSATVSVIAYYVSVVASAAYIGFVGLKELVVERKFSVEFLMAVAVLGAVYLSVTSETSYMFEAATVLLLYCVAEYLEGYIQERARRTVEKLSTFMPDKARVIENGQERSLNVAEVRVGMTLLVKPGERIPLDGNVVEGFSNVDQALVTGESMPVGKMGNDC